ncbi:MAG TPA: isochorismatase family cysteine hydrolase [bacterium]|nr:isochorismatase family cysteine hydrolase [bacterium]
MLTFQGREIPESLAEIVDPRRTVVIVHDMQKDNTAAGWAYDKAGRRIDVTKILPPLVRFLEDARRHAVRVMYTQYTNQPNFTSYTDVRIRSDFKRLSDPEQRKALEGLVEDTPGWATIDELKPQSGEIIIRKFRVDAFIGTPLELFLRLNNVRTLIHTGIATEVGILPTAWHALNVGFFPVVPDDCVGPMEPQYHEDAMRFLRRLAIPARSSEIVEAWGGAPRR